MNDKEKLEQITRILNDLEIHVRRPPPYYGNDLEKHINKSKGNAAANETAKILPGPLKTVLVPAEVTLYDFISTGYVLII